MTRVNLESLNFVEREIHRFCQDENEKPLIAVGVSERDTLTIIIKKDSAVYSLRCHKFERVLNVAMNFIKKKKWQDGEFAKLNQRSQNANQTT